MGVISISEKVQQDRLKNQRDGPEYIFYFPFIYVEWGDARCEDGVCMLSQKDIIVTTGKVDDVRRVVSNDAFCIQVSALKWILECQQGNGDSGGFGRTPGKHWVTQGVRMKKEVSVAGQE